MSNLEELNALYRDTLARAEGESANEGSEHKDPDTWLLARGTEGVPDSPTVIGGVTEATTLTTEQAVIAANQALAQLQAAKTEAEQLVINLRTRLAEMDDLDVFTQRVNYYREKQDELETMLAQLNQTRAATEEARDEAQVALRSASLEKGNANRTRAEVAQEVEANAAQIALWRQELGNANNVYTRLEMLGESDASPFPDVLQSMSGSSVGYFFFVFDGDSVPNFVSTAFGDTHEFIEGLSYRMQFTINRHLTGYLASVVWTAFDGNGVYSPVTYEDRAVFGTFDTGWVVRNCVQGVTVYGG